MGETVRFGVSMDRSLVALLDELSAAMGHENRSQTIRTLVRQRVVEAGAIEPDRRVVGTVTLTYRYGTRLPSVPVTDYPSLQITTNIQTHVDDEVCVKVLVVTGTVTEVHAWSRRLIAARDVVGQLTVAATDEIYRELRGE
ncbi:MAG: CopG family ribbon-helix-helix protein [Spirochaetota bacterium]